MPKTINPATLTQQIQSLIKQKAKHSEAVRVIDQTLEQIQRLLGAGEHTASNGNGNGSGSRTPARARQGRTSGRRKRGRFAMSGEESILTFIKKHGSPSTRELREHWQSEGRGGTSDNALSKLVKEKKLKRVPMKGERGSRYELA